MSRFARFVAPALAVVTGFAPAARALTSATAPTPEQLRNAEVRGLPGMGTFRLRGGVHQGPPAHPDAAARPLVALSGRLTATGELDGRPGAVRVALLAVTAGGSGVEVYLAVFGLRGGQAEALGLARVGDRVQVRGLEVRDGLVLLDVVQAGPSDPACCPTQLARRAFELEGGTLRERPAVVTGTLSLSTLSAMEWTLAEVDGKPLPAGVTAPTLRVEGGKATGFAGCNRYFGAVEARAPGQLSFGPLGATRMACAGPAAAVEEAFLLDLGHGTSYLYLDGWLGLAWQDGDRAGLLLFSR